MSDTSILALITAVSGLLILIVQTWGAIQIAKVKEIQKDTVVKSDKTNAKLDEVHVAVTERTAMLLKLEEMHAKISKLEAAADVRLAADAGAAQFAAGRKQEQEDQKA